MKVRILVGPRAGRVLDWPDRQARALVAAGRAELLDGDAVAGPKPTKPARKKKS